MCYNTVKLVQRLLMHKLLLSFILLSSYMFASQVQTRVVGGSQLSQDNTMWSGLVSMYIDGKPRCQGALIDKEWILTSAHCVTNKGEDANGNEIVGEGSLETQRVSILIGSFDDRDIQNTVGVSEIYSHPQYHFVFNDVALIKLSAPVSNAVPMS